MFSLLRHHARPARWHRFGRGALIAGLVALVGGGTLGVQRAPAPSLPTPPTPLWSVTVSATRAWWLSPLNAHGAFQWTQVTPTTRHRTTIAHWWTPPKAIPLPLATTWQWAAEWTWHRTAAHPPLSPTLQARWTHTWGHTGPLYATTWTPGIPNTPLSPTNPLILMVVWHAGGNHWRVMLTRWARSAQGTWSGSVAALESYTLPERTERLALLTPLRPPQPSSRLILPKGLTKQAVQKALKALEAHPQ